MRKPGGGDDAAAAVREMRREAGDPMFEDAWRQELKEQADLLIRMAQRADA
jgi:hypothetical protein